MGGKESTCQCKRQKRPGFDPWVGKIPWRRKWQPTPVSLPGESHGQKSLEGYSPWGYKEQDTAKQEPRKGLLPSRTEDEGPGWGWGRGLVSVQWLILTALLGELFSVTDGDTEGPGGEGSLCPAHPLPPLGKILDPAPFSMN